MTEAAHPQLRRGIACAIGTAAIFGIYPPAMRAVYAHGGNAVFVIVAVAWARALALAAWCLLGRKPLFRSREDIKQGITGGFFQAMTIAGISASLVFLPGPVASVISYTYAIMLLFYTAFRGETKMDAATVLTTFAAFGGLTLVLELWQGHPAFSLAGIGFALIGAVGNASRVYVLGHQTKRRDPMVVGAECLIFTALFASLLMLYRVPVVPEAAGYRWMLIACASQAAASFGMFYGISLLGSFKWGLFSKIEPIFTALFSVWFLGEVLQIQQYIGILIVIGSLAVYQLFEHRRVAVLRKAA